MTANKTTAITRQEFGGTSIQPVAETAALAVAAQAKASIEAHWIIAQSQPRNMEAVRLELLKECLRPSFAESAVYLLPIGEGIRGLSIRFVEAAQQAMGNVASESTTVYDDEDKRIVSVSVTDFQRNVFYRKQITITKLVERRYLQKGQVPVSQRVNSSGETTYTVHASEGDLLTKEGALVSKAMRTNGLRIIPGWLQDECLQIIDKTAADEAARDPDAEKRKLLDGFGQIGIMPGDLEEYLGHPLGQIVAAELVQLRAIWKTIQASETTWVETLAHRNSIRGEDKRTEEPPTPVETPRASSGVQGVKDAIARKGKPPGVPSAPPRETPPPCQDFSEQESVPPPDAPGPMPERPTIDPAQAKLDAERVAAKAAYTPPETVVTDLTPSHVVYANPTKSEVEKIKADIERSQAKPLEAKGVAPGSKRPSRSKAAQKERQHECKDLEITNERKAQLYLDNGDPRNKAKGYREPVPRPRTVEQMEADAEAAAARVEAEGNVATPHNPETGEVIDMRKEPAWIEDSPPPPESPKPKEAF